MTVEPYKNFDEWARATWRTGSGALTASRGDERTQLMIRAFARQPAALERWLRPGQLVTDQQAIGRVFDQLTARRGRQARAELDLVVAARARQQRAVQARLAANRERSRALTSQLDQRIEANRRRSLHPIHRL